MSDDRDPDLDAWEPQEPSAGFAERVVSRVQREPRPINRRARAAGAFVILTTIAAAVAIYSARPPTEGDIRAESRREVAMGSRVVAVLEPGAHVRWVGDELTQDGGRVFYRVERGAPLVVHTPAGDVKVLGTCFFVNVKESAMNGRDVKSGVIGGVISTLAFVGVYEGKVAVSHAGESMTLSAGQGAQVDEHGIGKAELSDGEGALDRPTDDPLMTANANLADIVRDYKHRLESLEGEQAQLKKKLADAEEKLALADGGAGGPKKSEFDLSTDDWATLAKDGTVKYETPCIAKRRNGTVDPSSFDLDKLGLAPTDVPTLQSAYGKSRDRMWGTVIPLCAQAIGSEEVAEKLGPNSCIHVIVDVARTNDPKGTNEAMYQVGEIRSGQRAAPGANDAVSPVLKLFLALTAESKSFESDLAQSFGPEEAHRLAYARDGMCLGTSQFGGPGPREKK